MSAIRFEPHALYPAPDVKTIQVMADKWNCDARTAAERFRRARSEMIARDRSDPFNFAIVPTIWTMVWALLDWPYWPKSLKDKACKRFDCDLWEVMRRMRQSMGFDGPVTCLWISGANGSGKTELMSYMVNVQMAAKEKQQIVVMSTGEQDSVDSGIHKKLYNYIPKQWKGVGRTETGYVAYKSHTGFPGGSYTFPNGSKLSMRFYGQDPTTAGEGFDAHAIFPDESIPSTWYNRLFARTDRMGGFIVLTNTPQTGYTEVVKDFMEGVTITRWSCGYMLPKDGGEQLQHSALGLTEEQFEELKSAHAERPQRAPRVPECMSEDCWGWLEDDESGWWNAQRPIDKAPSVQEGGRLFEAVPRIGRCKNTSKAVVFFHSQDNPFGLPRNLVSSMSGMDAERIKCRLYGVVTSSRSAVFAKFSRNAHVVRREAIPVTGTRYWVNDPSPGRNAFILFGIVKGDTKYIYREFPGNYFLPDIGHPGPWAKMSGKKGGVNDGERGDATHSFGWGVARYKAITAWIERWVEFEQWAREVAADPDALPVIADGVIEPANEMILRWPRNASGDFLWPDPEEVERWEDPESADGSAEPMERRLMDPRGGAAAHLATEGVSTLIGDYNEMGMRVEPAFSGTVMSGVDAITGALDTPGGGKPKLLISEECANLIWAMEHWKDVDGERSATKDPIDTLRYMFTSDCVDVERGPETGPRRRGFGASARAAEGLPEVKRPERKPGTPGRRRVRVRVC